LQNSVLSTSGANTGLLGVIRGIQNKEMSNHILKEYYQAQVTNMADRQALSEEAMRLLQKSKPENNE
ncbi:MAG: hypothetical protein ABUK01_05550, partial [Leptospirales bacterium]